MKKLLLILAILFPTAVAGQTAAFNGFCDQGSYPALLSGLPSSNLFQNLIPQCTVSVYLTGTTTLATIYSDAINTHLTNPFTASTKAQWLFYAANGVGYDVVMSGGFPPYQYQIPVTLTDLQNGASGGGGPVIQTNGVNNLLQTLLNFTNSPTISFTNTSGGIETASCNEAGGAASKGCYFIPITGSGAPTALCNIGNVGQNYYDLSSTIGNPNVYICKAVGISYFWEPVAPVVQVDGTPISPSSPADFVDTSSITWAFTGGQIKATAVGTSQVIQVNGTPLITETPANFVDTSSVQFTNPSAGIIEAVSSADLLMAVTPPVSGQYIIVRPTGNVVVPSVVCEQGVGWGVEIPPDGGGLNTGGACTSTINGFSLSGTGVSPSSVTAVYAYAISSYQQGYFYSGSYSGDAMGGITALSCAGNSILYPATPYTLQQSNSALTGITGSGISGVVCTAQTYRNSSIGSRSTPTYFNIPDMGLIVYYSGPPVTQPNTILVAPPLTFNTENQTLGVDPSFPTVLNPLTIETIPNPDTNLGMIVAVTDAKNSFDSFRGGGSSEALLYSAGGQWNAYQPLWGTANSSVVCQNGPNGTLTNVGCSTGGNITAPSVVQTGTFTPTGGACHATATFTAGNAIIIEIENFASVSDSTGDTFNSIYNNGSGETAGQIASGIAGGSTTITVTAGGFAGTCTGGWMELHNVPSTSPIDGTVSSSYATTVTSYADIGPITTTQVNDLLFSTGWLSGCGSTTFINPAISGYAGVSSLDPDGDGGYVVTGLAAGTGIYNATWNPIGVCQGSRPNGYSLFAIKGVSGGGGSSGFPITLGSTSIAANSTTTSVAGLTVNGVDLDSTGSTSLFLNQAGGYTTPSGSISGTTNGQVTIAGASNTITSSVALGNAGSDIPQLSSGLLAVSVLPKATSSAFGAVEPDNTTITISGGIISSVAGGSGTVTNIATGAGLTGGPITTTGTISCVNGSSSVKGCVEVDGLTITASGGVISAVSGGGTTTNPLTMNNSGSGAASGTTFNGSTPETISYNTIGAAQAPVTPVVSSTCTNPSTSNASTVIDYQISSTCALTLPSISTVYVVGIQNGSTQTMTVAPPSGTITIGATTTSLLTIPPGETVTFWYNTTTSAYQVGSLPAVAGSGVTVTPGATGNVFSSTGGGSGYTNVVASLTTDTTVAIINGKCTGGQTYLASVAITFTAGGTIGSGCNVVFAKGGIWGGSGSPNITFANLVKEVDAPSSHFLSSMTATFAKSQTAFVEWFGGVSDGVVGSNTGTDNLTPFTNALAALTVPGTVSLGTCNQYAVSTTVTQATGQALTSPCSTPGEQGMIFSKSSSAAVISSSSTTNIKISNLTIARGTPWAASAPGLYLHNISKFSVTNNIIEDSGWGVDWLVLDGGAGGATGQGLTRNTIYWCANTASGSGTPYGIHADGGTSGMISTPISYLVTIDSCGASTGASVYATGYVYDLNIDNLNTEGLARGWDIEANTAHVAENIHITHFTVDNAATSCAKMNLGTDLRNQANLADGYCLSTSGNGIDLVGSSGVMANGITFYSTNNAFINFGNQDQIENNTIYASTTGMTVTGYYNSIIGNQVYTQSGTGFVFSGAVGNQFKGNLVRTLSTGTGASFDSSSNSNQYANDNVYVGPTTAIVDNGTGNQSLYTGVTGSIGGGALLAGACSTGTVTLSGKPNSNAVATATASTSGDPGAGFIVQAQLTSSNVVTVSVCAIVAGTPSASTYNVRVQ